MKKKQISKIALFGTMFLLITVVTLLASPRILKGLCKRGHSYSCNIMVKLQYDHEAGAPKNMGKYKYYLEKSCDLESEKSCLTYARLLLGEKEGGGGKSKALKIWKKLCNDFKSPNSCYIVGSIIYDMHENKSDAFEESLPYYEKACRRDKPLGCWFSAFINRKMKNKKSFENYFKKAMRFPVDKKMLSTAACYYNVLGNRKKSLEYLRKAVAHDKNYKKEAKKDQDFQSLWNDEEFKKILSDEEEKR